MKYQLFVNRQGEVQKAYCLDSAGKSVPLSILKPGSQSYIVFDPATAQTIRITTPLGEQECYVYVQTMDMEKFYEEQGVPNTANIKGITRNILLISKDPKVKFRVLGGFGSINMSADDYNVEFSADKITQYYGKQNTNAQSYTIMAEQGYYTAEYRSKVAPLDPNTAATSSVPSDAKTMPVNESFDSGLGGWALETFNGATGDLRRDKGEALGTGPSAKFSIYSGSVDWYVQMIKPFSSKKGKIYTLTATLKADKPCTIQVYIEQNHEPHNRILSGQIKLDTNPKTFTFISSKAATDQMKLTFMAGSQPGRIIWVDSVTLQEE
jgi:hypothetical protein